MNGTGFLALLQHLRIPGAVAIRMAISATVALVLWGFVTTQQDPLAARLFNGLAIQSPELPGELVIPVDLGTATVRIEGPTSLVQDVTADSLAPRINVSGITGPGTYIVPVEIDAPGAVDREITPAQLSVIVDDSASRSFTLEWVVEDVEDRARAVSEVIPTVTEVTVTGPASIVERVARVIFTVDIANRTTSYTDEFELTPVDANDVPIPEVSVRPRRVEAAVEIEARGRLVPVLVPTSGSPAEGYDLADRAVSPPAVLLDGPDDVLTQLVSVSTEPVNIEGAFTALTRRVNVTDLPPGVEVVDPGDGTVLVVVQFQQRGNNQTLADQTVIIGDVPPGFEAVAEPAAINVVVFASENALGALRSGDVAPRVSARGLEPGTHELRPAVLVPPDVQWIRTEPATVQVTIRPIPPTAAAATSGPIPPAASPQAMSPE
ncbi:MAG: CdaR family protein [Chloroflexota bacterium]|nr:CdaR family protein [Chloroflexota bacterium]